MAINALHCPMFECRLYKGMEGYALKQAYGDIVTFHGTIEGIDKEGTTVDDVREQVRVRVDQLAPGGGYILATCNHMIDVQPELVEALFDAAHEYGRYA